MNILNTLLNSPEYLIGTGSHSRGRPILRVLPPLFNLRNPREELILHRLFRQDNKSFRSIRMNVFFIEPLPESASRRLTHVENIPC